MPTITLPVTGLVMCLFAVVFQSSSSDLLSEARYSESIREHPDEGPALLTYVWFGMSAASLVAVVLSGPAIFYFGPKLAYAVSVVPAALLVPFIYRGYMEERQMSQEEMVRNRSRFLDETECIVLCFVMLVSSLTLLFIGLFFESPLFNSVA